MVYLRLTKIAGAVNWFRFLNCFLKTVSNNQFFNFYRNNFQYFRPQKRICFCAIVNWIYYRMFEGSLMAQIISAFFANSENLLHNSRRTTIRDSVHLNGENLQISNMYGDKTIFFKKYFKSRLLVVVYES